jgi:hypothetical protein
MFWLLLNEGNLDTLSIYTLAHRQLRILYLDLQNPMDVQRQTLDVLRFSFSILARD